MTTEDYIKNGYEIANMKITNADLKISDLYFLNLEIDIEGDGIASCYGGVCLGKAHPKYLEGSARGEEAIMKIMNTLDADSICHMKDKYCRVAIKNHTVKAIGNIIYDKWFSYEEHFEGEE